MADTQNGEQLRGNRNHISLLASVALVVGLASLFSTLLIYSGTVISFLRFEQTELFMSTFAETILLAAALIGTLLAGIALSGRHIPFMLLGAGGGICYICCSLSFVYFSWFGSPHTGLVIALSIAAALGDVCLILVWGRLCARFKIRQALMVVSLASILSAGICYLYAVLPLPGVTIAFVLSTIVATIVPLALAEIAKDGKPEILPGRGEDRKALATMASLADVIVAPGLGLLVFAFVMAIMRTTFNESQTTYLIALAIDAVALLAYAAIHKNGFSLRGGIHQTFLPLMAMILLAATSIASSVGHGSGVVTFLTYALYSLAAILTLATLCAIANAGEFSSDLVFSTAILLFSTASFLGQSFASILDDMTGVAVTVITILYAFTMVVSSYIKQQPDTPIRQDDDQDVSDGSITAKPDALADHRARLAAEYKLTAREQEILMYLAEGHSGSYISDVLFISPNTTRTHIHNIYRKLDVSSREDILRLTKGQDAKKSQPET